MLHARVHPRLPLSALPLPPSGLKDLQVLKTTQSGYEGFLKDKYTALPDSTDRILATSITATWKYQAQVPGGGGQGGGDAGGGGPDRFKG